MDVVQAFVEEYSREVDFYDAAARLAQQQIEELLRSEGIRAIVTARAKRPDRLEPKLRKRAREKNYITTEAIRNDIADLAGVRVALYFPGQQTRVNTLIAGRFDAISEPKEFPEQGKTPPATTIGGTYIKRFHGYAATHHRVRLKGLTDDNRRYSSAIIEVQVASVLMHAWAEVEHDLVYKPLSGALSGEEHAILDELNGLVLTGEIALERLEQAGKQRLLEGEEPFDNQYELASYLYDHVRRMFKKDAGPSTMGRADWLFRLLVELDLITPKKLQPYLDVLDPEIEQRPIAEQVIDKVIEGSNERYETFERIRGIESPYAKPRRDEIHQALGFFIERWVKLEECLTKIVRAVREEPRPGPAFSLQELRLLGEQHLFPDNIYLDILKLRQFRNIILHGETDIAPEVVRGSGNIVEEVLRSLATCSDSRIKEPALKALEDLDLKP